MTDVDLKKREVKRIIEEVGWEVFEIRELREIIKDIQKAIRKKEGDQSDDKVMLVLNDEVWEIIEEKGEEPSHVWKMWYKKVTGIDKTKDDAYSLIGEFVKDKALKKSYWNKGDIIVHGIRQGPWNEKRRYNVYRLFWINEKGEVELVAKDTSRSWAVNFWEPIEKLLNGENPNTDTDNDTDDTE